MAFFHLPPAAPARLQQKYSKATRRNHILRDPFGIENPFSLLEKPLVHVKLELACLVTKTCFCAATANYHSHNLLSCPLHCGVKGFSVMTELLLCKFRIGEVFSFAGCSEKFSKIFGVICFCLITLDLWRFSTVTSTYLWWFDTTKCFCHGQEFGWFFFFLKTI